MFLGHKIGLTFVYYKPTEDEMLAEYMKAVNNLTINEENRLKIKVDLLERKEIDYAKLDVKIDALQREFYQNKVRTGWAGLTKENLSEEVIERKVQERRAGDKATRKFENKILQDYNEYVNEFTSLDFVLRLALSERQREPLPSLLFLLLPSLLLLLLIGS